MIVRAVSIVFVLLAIGAAQPASAEPFGRPDWRGPFGGGPGGERWGDGERRRTPDKLHEGDTAIDFTLRTLDGKNKIRLSNHRGEKPVALIFGSYT